MLFTMSKLLIFLMGKVFTAGPEFKEILENNEHEDSQIANDYLDVCNYTAASGNMMACGNLCSGDVGDLCQCGLDAYDLVFPRSSDQYCCIPTGSNCTWKDRNRNPVCRDGKILPMSSPCQNAGEPLQCYNGYRASKYLSRKSHYTCPHTCVPTKYICKGVNWCPNDNEVCGPDLRCPENEINVIRGLEEKESRGQTLNSNLTSSLITGQHYFCLSDQHMNDKIFHSIDRSDENTTKNDEVSDLFLDGTSLISCVTNEGGILWKPGIPGIMCGSLCIDVKLWCWDHAVQRYGSILGSCDIGSEKILPNDRRLCSIPQILTSNHALNFRCQ